jgi:hypothetical protein
MCANISDPNDPRFSCDCHLWPRGFEYAGDYDQLADCAAFDRLFRSESRLPSDSPSVTIRPPRRTVES